MKNQGVRIASSSLPEAGRFSDWFENLLVQRLGRSLVRERVQGRLGKAVAADRPGFKFC